MLDKQLEQHEELLRERQRLVAARATLLGDGPPGQISSAEVASYLAKHPGARPAEIASALGVSANRISAHLFRGKSSRFVSRADGWYVREPLPKVERR